MTLPDPIPPRLPRVATAPTSPEPPAVSTAAAPAAEPAPANLQWRRAAMLLSLGAQLITISALVGADRLAATWPALLLAVAPAPLAALALFGPARLRLPTVLAAAVVLVIGIVGTITHIGVFFVFALAALVGAAITLWRQHP
jgi:hypothetical protein